MPKTVRRKKELKVKKPRLGTIPKINNKISSRWMFIALFIVAYAVLYFILRNKLPFTPDFSSSDAFHSNVSFKYYLWQSIRSGQLPFWTDKLAGGFPLIAETQIGAFFLPHYLIFPLLSTFSHAYIFLFAFHLFLLSVGMFVLLKLFRIPSFLSFWLSLTLTWCGAVSFRWVHFNFLQVFSLSPILFWTYFKWNETKGKGYALFMSFLICQMIFAGHMQTTFNILFGLTMTHLLLDYPLKFKTNVVFFLIILLGFILAAPQILPTIQLSHYSQRGLTNSFQYITSFLFNSKDLIGIYSAKALGSPQDATYVGNAANRIYWENTPYLGELFIITLIVASIYYFLLHKKQPYVRIFLLLSFFFSLLAFGGDSPLYFLFGMFPFNMFRTPSRYLVPSVFFLLLFAGLVFKKIVDKHKIVHIFVNCALAMNCCILIWTAFSYHVFVDSRSLFGSLNKYPKISADSYYFTFGGNEEWYKTFNIQGWKTYTNIDTYLFINTALLPNSNLLTGLSTFDVYTGGLKIRRSEYLQSIITNSLVGVTLKHNEELGVKLENLLQLYNIQTIISFQPLYLPHFSPVEVAKRGGMTISVLQNMHSKSNIFYIPLSMKSFSYIEDVEKEIAKETVSEDNSFAESLPGIVKQDANNVNAHINTIDDQIVTGTIVTRTKKFIVIKKGWYPEWHLYIDGKESKIYKTNLIHMGFYISPGYHTIEFRYIPTSFYIGCMVSLLGIVSTLIILTYRSRKNLDSF